MGHREVIREHLETLYKLTNLSDRFIDRCWSDKILTDFEKESLVLDIRPSSRASAFYNILRLKDVDAIEKVILIMSTDDYRTSKEVLQILKKAVVTTREIEENAPGSSSASASGFFSKEIKQQDTPWIAKHFSDLAEANDNKELIYGLLGLPQGDLVDLKKRAGTESYVFFNNCMNKFISANAGANFDLLNEKLVDTFPGLMGKIMNDRRAK